MKLGALIEQLQALSPDLEVCLGVYNHLATYNNEPVLHVERIYLWQSVLRQGGYQTVEIPVALICTKGDSHDLYFSGSGHQPHRRTPCRHENLDMDGICKACGADKRGIGE